MVTISNVVLDVKIQKSRLLEGGNEITVHPFFNKRAADFWQLHQSVEVGES